MCNVHNDVCKAVNVAVENAKTMRQKRAFVVPSEEDAKKAEKHLKEHYNARDRNRVEVIPAESDDDAERVGPYGKDYSYHP